MVKLGILAIICLGTSGFGLQPLLGQSSSSATRRGPVISAIENSPDNNQIVTGSQAGVFVRKTIDDSSPRKIDTALENVNAISFSPDGKLLAVAGGSPSVKGAIEIWSWPESKRIQTLNGHRDLVSDILWTAKENELISASADHTVRVWNLNDGTCVSKIEGHSGPVLALAISPDGSLLCSGSVDQTIRVWSTKDWKILRTLNNHLGTVHDLEFCPNRDESQQAMLASAGADSTLRIWYPAIGRMVRIVRHPAPVKCLCFDENGKSLFSGSNDGNVRLISADDHKIENTIPVSKDWIVSLSVFQRIVAGTSAGELIQVDE